MDIKDNFEALRAILFTGRPKDASSPMNQEAYIEYFEARVERDPETEWQALRKYAKPILPLYRQQLADMRRMESLFGGTATEALPDDEDTLLNRLHADIMELETEEEWQSWVNQWVKRAKTQPSNSRN